MGNSTENLNLDKSLPPPAGVARGSALLPKKIVYFMGKN